MKDLVDRIEQNRFVGREFLLWLWFESEVFETSLSASSGRPCALWCEGRIVLAFEKEESVLKGGSPASTSEAKEALRHGKLPREARLRLVVGEHDFGWVMKADALGFSGVTIPAELTKKDDDPHEMLYERMRLLEELEATLEALWRDFLALRLSRSWDSHIAPYFERFAEGEPIDGDAYLRAKQRALAPAEPRTRSA